MFRQRLNVRARFVIEPTEMGVGDEFQQVLVAGEVFGQQPEVEDGLALVGSAVLFQPRGFDEVEFAANQGLDALGLGLVVELDRAKEIAVVGDGQRAHSQFGGPVHQPVDSAAAVEQAVVRVDVEMDEIFVDGRQRQPRQFPTPVGASAKLRLARASRKPTQISH